MGELKYQNLREALDDFPEFDWISLNEAVVKDTAALKQWISDYSDLMQAIQDGTVKYDD